VKLAHLSDLHFAACSWNPLHLFSKRWLGNLNFLLGRRQLFEHARLEALPAFLKSLRVTTVLITGDLTTTSSPAEFAAVKQFTDALEKENLEVLAIPGNHDHYTRAAYKNRLFYNYFPDQWGPLPFSLKVDGVSAKKLENGWWIVGIDTALATSWVHSTGYFDPKIEAALSRLLSHIPAGDRVLLSNHFPFFQHDSPRKRLVRGEALEALVSCHPQIKIYCHGHTHRQCKANLQASHLPLILDTGSTTHRENGGWYLIDLSDTSASFYTWNKHAWNPA